MCNVLFVLFVIVLSVLLFSDYPFGIFKIFLPEDKWIGCVYRIPDEQNKSKRSTSIHKNWPFAIPSCVCVHIYHT